MNKSNPSPLTPIQTWQSPLRFLTFIFVLTTTIGFFVGVIFIEDLTKMSPSGVIAEYKGNSKQTAGGGQELKFEKSVNQMFITTHNHILGLGMLFFIFGFLYIHTGKITSIKKFIATEPIISLILTFGGLWLVRFVHSAFVYLVLLSGVLMVFCFLWMAISVLKACLSPD